MKPVELLPLEAIKLGLTARTKKEAIGRMVEIASKSGKIKNIDKVKKQVLEREALASTGIGNGVAFPHTRSDFIESLVASFAILKSPLDFGAIDGKPVQIIFLLLSREENVGKQLRYLSMYSRILSDTDNQEKLLKANSEAEIFDFFNEIE
jgi:mannitol/fructose-specific phosphotransferase system IIA component (Ntr-type)